MRPGCSELVQRPTPLSLCPALQARAGLFLIPSHFLEDRARHECSVEVTEPADVSPLPGLRIQGKESQPLSAKAVGPGEQSEPGRAGEARRAHPGVPGSDGGVFPSRAQRFLRTPASPGGDLREQLLLYILGEELQLEVGQGDFPRVLPLLDTLFRHFLVICFRRSKRMGCWL